MKEQPHFQLATHSPSQLALFRVEQERLVVQLASSEEAVSFSEITRINLQQTLGAYVAIVNRRSGRPLMIRSRCVLPGMKIEDRVNEYAELALVADLASAAAARGHRDGRWLAQVVAARARCRRRLRRGGGRAEMTRAKSNAQYRAYGGFSRRGPESFCLLHPPAAEQGRGTPYDPNAPPAKLLPGGDQPRSVTASGH